MKDMTEKHFDKEINSQIPANSGTAPDNDWNAETAQAAAPDSIIEVTRVLTKPVSPSPHTATNNGIIQDGDLNIEPIVFSVDSSLKFRQSLEKSGKRYQIQKLLATGGFGRIFLAEDRILGRKAVVKSLREELLDRPDAVEKFIAEAKLNAQLDHPAIVPLYSLDSDSRNGLHLAMQLVNGITLKEYLHRSRERQSKLHYGQRRYNQLLKERLEIFLHICDAIEYSHSRHIIHCDLKPDNIMIGRYGEVYVMDWGIACLEGTCRKERVEGTPSYMAPESLCDGQMTQRTDIFALGMILNEIATLRRPVFGNDSKEIILRICNGEFEPSTPLDPKRKISPALQAIIEKARAVDPARRYQSVKLLAADVRHLLFNEEVKACPDSLLQKLVRLMYQHRLVTLFSLLIVLAVSCAIAVFGMKRENLAIQQGNRKTLRYLNLQTKIEGLETQISSSLFLLQNQLKTLSLSLSTETVLPLDTNEIQFHEVSSFAPDAKNPPSDLIPTPFYKYPITLQHAAYFKSSGVSPETFKKWGIRLRSLHSQRLAVFFNNLIRQDNYIHSDMEDMKHFFRYGGKLRRITYVLNDGIALRFPGMYEEVSSPEDFLCEEYRSQPQPHRLTWTSTYLDSSNHLVAACWRPVLDKRGREIGAMGFEICFHELIRPIFELMRKDGKQTYFLLDSNDREIFSSQQKNLEEEHNESSLSSVKKIKFRYPELLKQIRQNKQVQFTTDIDGKATRISWKRISLTNWLMIQLTPLDTPETIPGIR